MIERADSLIANDAILTAIAELLEFSKSGVQHGRRMSSKMLERMLCDYEIAQEKIRIGIPLEQIHKAKQHIQYETDISGTEPVRLDPDGVLVGNRLVWELFRESISMLESKDELQSLRANCPGGYKKLLKRNLSSLDSYMYRSGGIGHFAKRTKLELSSNIGSYTDIGLLVDLLHRENKSGFSQMNRMRAAKAKIKVKGETFEKEKFDFSKSGITIFPLGQFKVIYLKKRARFLHQVHFQRLINLLKTTQNLAIAIDSLSLKRKMGIFDLVGELISIFEPILDDDPDLLGMCMKSARQMAVTREDKLPIMGESAEKMYLSALKPFRRSYTKYLYHEFRKILRTNSSMINFLNIYKMVPHPDTNTDELFDTILGTREPNPIRGGNLNRFAACTRKYIYESLRKQGMDVRLEATDDSPLAMELQEASNQSKDTMQSTLKFSSSAWSKVRIAPCRAVVKAEDIRVKPSSKASQCNPGFNIDEFKGISDRSRPGRGLAKEDEMLLGNYGTINDLASFLKGESDMDHAKSLKRFRRVIELHEKFEENYPGVDIDDIPAGDLANFLKDVPNAGYLIGTEPKLGEVHKKVTRLFYMAEQELKLITQRVERLAKQVSRNQAGVSITKSFSSRRKDLENFCDTMTGPDSQIRSVFVSFDMSEFSKKFPNILTRAYGSILAEVTGEKWLERIDLIFRASTVIMNSRGNFRYLSGVRGGFEGFLNFVWSSIHSSVMTIALESTGTAGEILTYSDDGILRFTAGRDMDNHEIRKKILRIKEIYESYGLIFHLGKTLASFNVWEYLGDYCVNCRIEESWIKELVSIGIIKNTKGLNPVKSRIDAVSGQADAMLSNSGPLYLAYILKRLRCAEVLLRVKSDLSPRVLEALLILPPSLGGFRIPAPSESCVLSSLTTDAEFISDLILMKNLDQSLAAAVVNGSSKVLTREKLPMKSIMRGSVFYSTLPDTSGNNVLHRAMECIEDSVGKAKFSAVDPLTTERARTIEKTLFCTDNVNPKVVAELFKSLPEWNDFTERKSMVKGSGAMRLIKRRDLRDLQNKDTNVCMSSCIFWSEIITGYEGTGCSPLSFYTRAERVCMPGIRLEPLRLPLRAVMTGVQLDLTDGDIQVVEQIPDHSTGNYLDTCYREPHIKGVEPGTTVSWFSEAIGDSESRRARRFVDSVARVVAYSPDCESLIMELVRDMGYLFPIIPGGLKRGAHRRGKGRAGGHAYDVRLMMSRVFQSSVQSKFLGKTREMVYGLERGDRTTYLEQAKHLSLVIHEEEEIFKMCKAEGIRGMTIKIDIGMENLCRALTTHVMTFSGRDDLPFRTDAIELPKKFNDEFIASYMEYSQFKEMERNIEMIETPGEKVDPDTIEVLKILEQGRLVKWITNTVYSTNKFNIRSTPMPRSPLNRNIVFLESLREAAVELMNPILRRQLSDNMFNLVREDNGGMENLVKSEGWQDYLAQSRKIADTLLRLDIPEINSSSVGLACQSDYQNVKSIQNIFERSSLTSNAPLLILRSGSEVINKVSSAHAKAIRQSFTNSISKILSTASSCNWEPNKIAERLKIALNIDLVLDCLYSCRPLIRKSSHRPPAHPYNRKSAIITLFKMRRLAFRILTGERWRGVSFKERRNRLDASKSCGVLPPEDQEELFKFFEKHHWESPELGEDHSRMISSPLPQGVESRVSHLLGITMEPKKSSAQDCANDLSTFYSMVLEPLVKRIAVYPSELERSLLARHAPSQAAKVEALSVSTSSESIPAYLVQRPNLPETSITSIIELLSAHLNSIYSRTGITGLTPGGKNTAFESSIIGGLASHNGTKLYYSTDSLEIPDDNGLNAFVALCKSANAAVDTYLQLSSAKLSSISLISNGGGTQFYVIGIVSSLSRGFDYKYKPKTAYEDGIQPEMIVSKVTISQEAGIVRRDLDEIISRRREPASYQSHFIHTYIRSYKGGTSINDFSPLLQAAGDIALSDIGDQPAVCSYALLIAWKKDITDLDRLPRLVSSLIKRISNLDGNELTRLVTDIGLAYSWLKGVNITSGSDIEPGEVANIINKVVGGAAKMRVLIPAVAAAMDYKPLDKFIEALSNVEDSDLVGGVSSCCYEAIQNTLYIEGSREGMEDETDDVDNLLDELGI